jgi:hypothetical protein
MSEAAHGSGGDALPTYFAVMRFLCKCFEVELTDFEERLKIVRDRETEPDRYFPMRISREMLCEAEEGRGDWRDGLTVIAREALYARMNWRNDKVLSGFAGHLAERLVSATLRIYQEVGPKLDTAGLSRQTVLWVLVEEIFLPTVYIELALNRQRGIGNEFHGDTWYLPVKDRFTVVGPVQRVIDYWLRAAEFRNGYDVGKALNAPDSEAIEKRVNRWKQGKAVPRIVELHHLVERFRDKVPWSGTAEEWMSRFTLACAVQKLCETMDTYFAPVASDASLGIARRLQNTHELGPAVDDDLALGDPYLFFAAWLLQRRLVKEGRWETEVAARVREAFQKKCPENATDEEMEEFRAGHGTNAGNWFLELIERGIVSGELLGAQGKPGASFCECMWAVGVQELNAVLDSKRAGGPNARQP